MHTHMQIYVVTKIPFMLKQIGQTGGNKCKHTQIHTQTHRGLVLEESMVAAAHVSDGFIKK